MCGEERKTKGEVGVGEHGQRLHQDVGDGLVTREVRVELVSDDGCQCEAIEVLRNKRGVRFDQIELIISTS